MSTLEKSSKRELDDSDDTTINGVLVRFATKAPCADPFVRVRGKAPRASSDGAIPDTPFDDATPNSVSLAGQVAGLERKARTTQRAFDGARRENEALYRKIREYGEFVTRLQELLATM